MSSAIITILVLALNDVVVLVNISRFKVYATRLKATVSRLCAILALLFFPGFQGAFGGGVAELDQ
ncbi:MAG: hypothetical protein LC721_07135 [Actinobacteria bacterium]|nr:hypothetical protein [Actinomycetota bacterium]